MRIVAAFCIHLECKSYLHKSELNFLSFFNRSSVEELLCEFAVAAAESLQHNPGRKIFQHTDMQICCHRIDSNVMVLFTDLEYPTRVTFDLLRRLHEDPSQNHLETILRQCQDPCTVDTILRTQQQLDETLVIMHENVTKILQRGDQVDDLVEKSASLSAQSKLFYKTATQHNSCCGIQ